MRTIIAPVDFTNDSKNALEYAADMASLTRCDLLIVHVCPYPVAVTEAPLVTESMEGQVEDAVTRLEELKEKMIARTKDEVKVTTVVKKGGIIESINKCCSSAGAYAVVMGRNTATAFERFLFGSSTVSAMKTLGCPLIIVPPGSVFNGIRNIIGIACDFREVIETLPVDEIRHFVRELKANLHVLHVSREAAGARSHKTIKESGWFHSLVGDLKPAYHFIKGNDTERAIIEYADKHRLDLLITIPKKHYLLEKLFQHSHSRQLVLHAHVPVMAIHE